MRRQLPYEFARTIVNEANSKALPFLVIGGHAVNAHGFSRFTFLSSSFTPGNGSARVLTRRTVKRPSGSRATKHPAELKQERG